MSTAALGLDEAVTDHHGRFQRLYYGQTKFDFVRRRKIWFAVSSIVILAGIVSLAVRGLNYDIEFVGGTSWQVPSNGVSVSTVRSALGPLGLGGATITTLGSGSKATLQIEAKLSSTSAASGSAAQSNQILKVENALVRLTHQRSINSVTVETVGPTWGGQVTHKAVEALIVFFILIAIYISIFFEWKMALAAIIAVIHDILVTVGIYSLTFFLVTPDTVVAFLTVLGYSLYDTIVVFDRVRDNTKGLGATGKLSITDVVNLSMNQTLARSVNTSLVAILPILAVLVLGAEILGATTLQYFGLALLIGLASGAYSSIFIASPLVAMLKEHERRYSDIRHRLEARGLRDQLLSPAAVAAGVLDEREAGGASRRRRGKGGAQREVQGPLRPGRSTTLQDRRPPPDARDARSGADVAGPDGIGYEEEEVCPTCSATARATAPTVSSRRGSRGRGAPAARSPARAPGEPARPALLARAAAQRAGRPRARARSGGGEPGRRVARPGGPATRVGGDGSRRALRRYGRAARQRRPRSAVAAGDLRRR